MDCQKHLFDLPANAVYLNCSFFSPLLKCVREKGIEGIERKCQPWLITPELFFSESDELRSQFAGIVGASKDNIALHPSASYGLAVAAKNIPVKPGQNIIVLKEEFPSNVYIWRELAAQKQLNIITVEKQPEQDWTEPIIEQINNQTGIVAVANCHWTDGSKVDLKKISAAVKSVGAALVIDGSQSIGAYPFKVKDIEPDFLTTVGYKWLFGPYSLAYTYVDSKYFTGEPLEYNWICRKNSENFANLVNYQDQFQFGAVRFDVGERSNFISNPMALVALQQLNTWGVENISNYVAHLTSRLEKRVNELGLICTPSTYRLPHMIGIHLPQTMIGKLTNVLRQNQIFVSVRGSSIRVSPHVYNDEGDIDRFIEVVADSLKRLG